MSFFRSHFPGEKSQCEVGFIVLSWLALIRKLRVDYQLYIFSLCSNIVVGILPVIVKSKQIKQMIVPSLSALGAI